MVLAAIATGDGEADLLPAGGRLAAEGRGGQQRPGAGPEVADVGAGVAGPLVEPEAGDVAGDVGAELHPQLDRIGVVGRGDRRRDALLQRVSGRWPRAQVVKDQETGRP